MRTIADRPFAGYEPSEPADHVSRTVAEVVELEKDDRTTSEHISDRITALTGSMFFVLLHVVLFVVWIIINFPWWGFPAFDPFPYSLLTMIVSLEAIFLSTFVLISQNRQAMRSERRARVDLQVDMIAEQEITKLMQLVMEIHGHLGIHRQHDPELQNMQKPTSIEHLGKIAQGEPEFTQAICK